MTKEVKINTPPQVKIQDFYFTIYSYLSQGKTPADICSILKISKQAISYYLRALKTSGSIKKVGYGVWETLGYKYKQVKKDGVGRSIRGHGFTFTLNLPKIPNWSKREDFLKKENIPFININKTNVQRIYFRNHKIWLCEHRIVIYYPSGKSYFSDSAEKSSSLAVYDLQQLIIGLENLFKIEFKVNKNYQFKVSRQHFARIKDELAKQCNKEGKKIEIRLDKGWFLIDNSFNLNEAETQGEGAVSYMDDNYTPFIRSLMERPFTAYDFENMYKTVKEMTLGYNENIKKHLKVMDDISLTLKMIRKEMKEKQKR